MMTFKIVTPDGIIYQNDIEKVTIPTGAGQITVLEGHAPLVSTLKPGIVYVHKSDMVSELSISSGILEIRPDGEIYLLADTAERAEHIDIDRAEKARERAEELMKKQESISDVDFARLQAVIDRELARITVGKKYRKLK